MADSPRPAAPSQAPTVRPRQAPAEDAVVCERCGSAQVYRMHAVWRCADCGFKTDCCGW